MELEAQLDAIFSQSGVGMTIVDKDLRIVRVNPAFGVFGDQSPAQLVGKTIAEAVPLLAAQIAPATRSVLETGVSAIQELVRRDPGDPAKTQYSRSMRCPVVAADGSVVGVVTTVIEITDLRNVQLARDDALARQRESDAAELVSRRAEAEASARYRAIFEGASIGIIRVDRTGQVVEVNPALEAMLGYTAAEFAAMKFQEYTHADDVEENLRQFDAIMNGPRHAYQFEKRCFRKDGEMIWVRVTSAAERDANGERNFAITMLEDITERKLAEARNREQARVNEHQATHDALTGLGNRRKLYGDVELALSNPGGRSFALGLFDLDGFKAYNDAFGHPAGDALLERLGRNLIATIGDAGRAYRMGGDEFCVVAPAGPRDAALIMDAADALTERGGSFDIGCSYGLVRLDAGGDIVDALQTADRRLYENKRSRRAGTAESVHLVLMGVVGEHDGELHHHVVGVARLAQRVGREMGLGAADLVHVRRAAALHDIGKIAIPDDILHAPRPLTADEWQYMRQHTVIGERIISAAPELAPVAEIVRSSHERWDGGGYPDGLAAQDIPLGARIVAVCDSWEAMTSSRAYRAAMSPTLAMHELTRCSGTQFDPRVVAAFVAVRQAASEDDVAGTTTSCATSATIS
jgi:PAS domain S-box-containing protein/diguanylate cyclase (GGDEF)-like protein/putative nucleotidyltransferase with HDIG domain